MKTKYTDVVTVWIDAETKAFYQGLATDRSTIYRRAAMSDIIREVLIDYKKRFELSHVEGSDPQGKGI